MARHFKNHLSDFWKFLCGYLLSEGGESLWLHWPSAVSSCQKHRKLKRTEHKHADHLRLFEKCQLCSSDYQIMKLAKHFCASSPFNPHDSESSPLTPTWGQSWHSSPHNISISLLCYILNLHILGCYKHHSLHELLAHWLHFVPCDASASELASPSLRWLTSLLWIQYVFWILLIWPRVLVVLCVWLITHWIILVVTEVLKTIKLIESLFYVYFHCYNDNPSK